MDEKFKHAMNNIFCGITCALQLLNKQDLNEKQQKYVDIMLKEVDEGLLLIKSNNKKRLDD